MRGWGRAVRKTRATILVCRYHQHHYLHPLRLERGRSRRHHHHMASRVCGGRRKMSTWGSHGEENDEKAAYVVEVRDIHNDNGKVPACPRTRTPRHLLREQQGRGLFACTNVAKGSLLFMEEAAVSRLSTLQGDFSHDPLALPVRDLATVGKDRCGLCFAPITADDKQVGREATLLDLLEEASMQHMKKAPPPATEGTEGKTEAPPSASSPKKNSKGKAKRRVKAKEVRAQVRWQLQQLLGRYAMRECA